MSIEAIGIVVIIVGAAALLLPLRFAFAIFVSMTLLGAAGAILLTGAGTIQPAHLMLGFLLLACFGRLEGSAARLSLRFPAAGFWLSAFTASAVVGAVFLPRLLARTTAINAVGSTDYGPSLLLVPLGPTSGNITQSFYAIADLMCFLLCSGFAPRRDGFRALARALAFYGVLNIGFAAIDLATYWTGTSYLLEPLRNADYQLHTDTVTTGLKRIVGSFPEASSFASTTLGPLGFAAELALAGVRPWLFGAITLVSLILLVFSTSSTAYVAAPILLIVLYVRAGRRGIRGAAPAPAYVALVLAPLAVTVLSAGIALVPRAREAVANTASTMLLDKADSQSGIERAQWNIDALRNFVETHGLGTGLGSVRASSFPVAVLANTGLLGALLMTAFIAAVLFGRDPPGQGSVATAVRDACRTACLGLLLGGAVSGTMADLGLPFFVFAALATARTLPAAWLATATPAVTPHRALSPAPSLAEQPLSAGLHRLRV